MPTENTFRLVKEAIDYAFANSPFYKARFSKSSIDPSQIKSIKDLVKLPFTTKEDLQNNSLEFLCVDRNKLVDLASTSGTTGKPLTIGLTEKDLQRLALNESRSFEIAGVGETDLIQLMTTMDRRFMAGLAYFLGARKLGAGIIRVGNGLPELQWQTIHELKPTTIVCVPSFLLKMLEYAEQNNIDPAKSSVRKAICIGEPVRQQDFTLNSLGSKIAARWAIGLYSTYASTEMATAFTECEAMKGGHMQDDLVYAEIIGENDQPVADGEAGELVVTTLGVEAMPLIRFRTGDICIAHSEPCKCGRTSLRLGPLVGRKQQMIKLKGTTIYPGAIYEVLERFTEINNYQVEVQTTDHGTDHVILHLGVEKPAESLMGKLAESLRASLRVLPELRFSSAEEVNKLIFPPHSRKAVKFADKRGTRFS